MKRKAGLIMTAVLLAMAAGCGKGPPLIDLREHEAIGVIEFRTTEEGELGTYITRKFIDAIRKDQGTVSITELGSEADVLKSIGSSTLDRDAFIALGKKHNVRTIFTGELEIADVMPDVSISLDLDRFKLEPEVEARLRAQMINTRTGATLWSGSGSAAEKIGAISLSGGRDFSFDADNPNRTFEKLLNNLIKEVTEDFRGKWEVR